MWFWLAMGNAVFGAVETLINKKALDKVSPAVMTWSVFALTLPLVAVWAFKDGIPQVNSLFYFGISSTSFIYLGAKMLRNHSMKRAVLSKINPLAAFGTIFSYIFALIGLGEQISLIGIAGILLTVLGAYVINVEKAHEGFWEPFKFLVKDKDCLIFMIGIFFTALSGPFDKTAVTNTMPSSPVLVLFAENLIMTILLTVYLIKKEKFWYVEVKNNFKPLFATSFFFNISTVFTFAAYTVGSIALISGAKRVELLFTMLLAYIFLKDKPPKEVWIGTAIMITGVILIKFA